MKKSGYGAEFVWRMWERFFDKTQSFSNRLLGVFFFSVFAFFLRALLGQVTEVYFPSVTFVAAILMSLYGGLGLGIMFTLLLSFAVDYFYISPMGHILENFEIQRAYLLIIIEAALAGLLGASLRLAFLKSRLAKQEAEAAVRARDELIGVVSHELKNPLMALQTGVVLIQKVLPKNSENEKSEKLIERLMPSIHRMNRLVTDLLEVTQIEARALKLEIRHANLQEIAEELIRELEPAAMAKGLDLKIIEIPFEARDVFCDPDRTGQILSNLINNSIKFTDKGGSIRLSTEKKGGFIEVCVADTGRGISKEGLTHVFDRFWQEKEVAYKGTGLGLSIAKGLVEAQGGKIWVESIEGQGARFFFTLPSTANAQAPLLKTA